MLNLMSRSSCIISCLVSRGCGFVVRVKPATIILTEGVRDSDFFEEFSTSVLYDSVVSFDGGICVIYSFFIFSIACVS